MSRVTMKEMMDCMNKNFEALNTKIDSIEDRVSKLETAKQSTATTKKSSKTSSKKSAPKPTDKWAKYEPKKDAEGFYIWKSYKACRQRYLNDNGKSYEEVGWMSKSDFAKAVKPFTDKFGEYVKKADR